MNADLSGCLSAIGLGVALLGCGFHQGENDDDGPTIPSVPPDEANHSEANEEEENEAEPVPDAPQLSAREAAPSETPTPPALSVIDALGRTRDDIDSVWGAPAFSGAWVVYRGGRRLRYRGGVAIGAQAHDRERDAEELTRAQWLGVPDDVMDRCERNLESYCVTTHAGVGVEERTGIYSLYPLTGASP